MNRRQPLQNLSNIDRSSAAGTSSLSNSKRIYIYKPTHTSFQSNVIKQKCFDQWKKTICAKKENAHFATPKKRKLESEADSMDELLKSSFFSSKPRRETVEDSKSILRTPHSTKRVATESGDTASKAIQQQESESSKLKKFPTFDEPAGKSSNQYPMSHAMQGSPKCKSVSRSEHPTTGRSDTDYESKENNESNTTGKSDIEESPEVFHGQVSFSIKASILALNRIQKRKKSRILHSEYQKYNLVRGSISDDVITFHSLPDVQQKLQIWQLRYHKKQ
jgi:hypothetical protein